MLFFIALVDATNIDIYYSDGSAAQATQTVGAFQFFDYNTNSSDYYHVSATKPIQVAQFAECHELETHSNTDPFLIMPEAVTNFKSDSYIFTSMDGQAGVFTRHTLHITIATGDKAGLLYDGSALSGNTWVDMATMPHSITRYDVNTGVHTLSYSTGALFSAFVYGQRNMESYALPVQPTPLFYNFTAQALDLEEAIVEPTTMAATDDTTMADPHATTVSDPDATTIADPDATTMADPDATTVAGPDATNTMTISIPATSTPVLGL